MAAGGGEVGRQMGKKKKNLEVSLTQKPPARHQNKQNRQQNK
jgi:hypothetical protein